MFARLLAAGTLVAAFALTGCASTRMNSQTDVAATTASYSKMTVLVAVGDLGQRQKAEKAFQQKLAYHGIECVPSHDLFFPGREHSEEEIAGRLQENGIEAILTVNLSNSGTSSTYVPETSQTKINAYSVGNSTSGTATTQTYGGYDIEKPWANFTVELWDLSGGAVTWVASASTGGNAWATGNTLLSSMASKTVSQLAKDGVIP